MMFQRNREILINGRKRRSHTGIFTAVAIILIALFAVIAMNRETTSLKSISPGSILPNNSVAVLDPNRLCVQNQYAKSLSLPLEENARLADNWIEHRTEHEKNLTALTIGHKHNHDRFQAFEVMGSCNQTCIGGKCRADKSKIACGVNENNMEAPCVVYSIGGNNKWEFEEDILKKTPCEVHTFDCTGEKSRFVKPDHPRLSFHYVCLGTKNKDATSTYGEFWTLEKMQKTLGHNVIDLFKADIEGYEFPMFESWSMLTDYRSPKTVLPMQVLVEVHYQTQMEELATGTFDDWKFGTDMIHLQARFLNMGYVVVVRDDNKACKHCTELTLVRFRCPPTINTIK